MTILSIILITLLLIGIFFNGLGSVGLMRFPDVYTRLHAATKCTTFGSIFTSFSVIIFGFYFWNVSDDSKFGVLALHAFVALVCLVITKQTKATKACKARTPNFESLLTFQK